MNLGESLFVFLKKGDQKRNAKMIRNRKPNRFSIIILTSFVVILSSYVENCIAANDTITTSSTPTTLKPNTLIPQVANASKRILKPIITGNDGVNTQNSTTNATLRANLTTNPKSLASDYFGDHSEASIFKPSFFKSLLGDRRRPASQASADENGQSQEKEEEEEEVTKTIVMPIKEPTEEGSAAVEETESLPSNLIKKNQLLKVTHGQLNHQFQQPKPEASLQLTSTEMNTILNDGEGPEFYRERERAGDGVSVGEEQNRLWTSASNGFGQGMGGIGGGGGGSFGNGMMNGMPFDGGDAAVLANHRLAQAASEEGFNHRFGSVGGYPGSDSELAGFGGGSGRLMQSPNEYSEFNAGAEYQGAMGGHSAGGFNGPTDYSPQSGLLRAGSGDYSPESGYGMGAGTGYGAAGYGAGAFGGGGYPNSPMLERHASELYGGGGDVGYAGNNHLSQGAGDLSSMYNGRLLSAGSHIPSGPFSSNSFGASDEYASRFGHSGSIGPEARNFATHNNMMLRGGSSQSGMTSLPGGDFKRGDTEANLGKLVPLSPIVPIADDFMNQNHGNYREASNNVEKGPTTLEKPNGSYQSTSNHENNNNEPEVHESLDDDASEQGDEKDDSNSSSGGNESDDDSPATASNARSFRGDGGASLVLNVPPPSDNSINQPTIDFARIGSAGYMAPQLRRGSQGSVGSEARRFLHKYGQRNSDESVQTDRSPVIDNPAHLGKYIIE